MTRDVDVCFQVLGSHSCTACSSYCFQQLDKMKTIYLLLAMIMIFVLSYFYISPTVGHLKDQMDTQAYQRTNLLEGIDTDYVDTRGKWCAEGLLSSTRLALQTVLIPAPPWSIKGGMALQHFLATILEFWPLPHRYRATRTTEVALPALAKVSPRLQSVDCTCQCKFATTAWISEILLWIRAVRDFSGPWWKFRMYLLYWVKSAWASMEAIEQFGMRLTTKFDGDEPAKYTFAEHRVPG